MAWFYWDPDPIFFTVPIINRPIAWYGVLFALGFASGYMILIHIFERYILPLYFDCKCDLKKMAYGIVDNLALFVVSGTIVGARLGHVFFYDWPYYKNNLLDIVKIWEGGLASHGGAVGVLIGLFLAHLKIKKTIPQISLFNLIDSVAVPTALVGAFIRLGNFFNQEILGRATKSPWGVIFGHPIDGSAAQPRHPVQLYEGIFYLLFFVVMMVCVHKGMLKKSQWMTGFFMIVVFSFRFIIEFFKESQSLLIDNSAVLLMGQILSIPFVLLGVVLIVCSYIFRRAN